MNKINPISNSSNPMTSNLDPNPNLKIQKPQSRIATSLQHIQPIEPQQQQMGLVDQFKQQMLKPWQPVPTLSKTIIMFFLMAAIFLGMFLIDLSFLLGIGIPMIVLSSSLTQQQIRYDNVASCEINSTCSLTFEVSDVMESPVFVYYEIHNFFQNHRLYAESFDVDQLTGNTITPAQAQENCAPIVYNSDLYTEKSPFDGSQLDQSAVANPCGLIPYTIFNDSFNILNPNNDEITVSANGIAWPTDIERYKLNNNQSSMWYNTTDQRFMNWMRIAAMPDFRKLWGRIDQDLEVGNYTVQITNKYDLSKINGEKYFVLSTSNFFGSRSNFISITYIAVGSLCLLIGFLFLMKKLAKKRKQY